MPALICRCRPFAKLLFLAALWLGGCPGNSPPPLSATKTLPPLTVLVVDDPALGQAIAREGRGYEGHEEEIKVQDLSLAEAEKAGRLPGDVVVFPAGLIGQFAEPGLILPLEETALEAADFHHRDVFAPLRMGEMRWGNRTLAVTLGSPRLLLAYRADIFEKLALQPPADWTEYQAALERLADREQLGDLAPPAEQPWHATVEPLAEGWAGQLLLARAAAYALHRDQVSPLFKFDSLEPLIAEPPYRRALEELLAAAKAGQFAEQALTPAAALDELLAGRAAMALTWPAPTSPAAKSEVPPKIGFAMLPGSPTAYNFATKSWDKRSEDQASRVPLLALSGRLGAVSSSSADPARAAGFLAWMAGREAGVVIAPTSAATTIFRSSQVASPGPWTKCLPADAAGQYADALAQTMALPRTFPGLRLPGRSEYLAALDEAVRQAAAGKQPPAEALAAAAEKWRAATQRLGTQQQQRANARSLGQQSL